MENNELQRLGQVAGLGSKQDRVLQDLTSQYLRYYGIDGKPQSQVLQKVIQFIKQLPEYKGQLNLNQAQNSWKQRPGVIQNSRQFVSKDADYIY